MGEARPAVCRPPAPQGFFRIIKKPRGGRGRSRSARAPSMSASGDGEGQHSQTGREPHQQGQGRVQRTRRRGGEARQGRQQGQQGKQETRKRRRGERVHGRQGQHAKGWDNWPHAYGNTVRHVVDDLKVEGSVQKNRKITPAATSTTPVSQLLCLLTRKRHHKEHRPQRSSESIDPTQHAKGRTGVCPGPSKETATQSECHTGGVQKSLSPLPQTPSPPHPPIPIKQKFWWGRGQFFFSSVWNSWALCFIGAVPCHFPAHSSFV